MFIQGFFQAVFGCSLSEKKYESCHWGCTYSKGKLLSILCANMYILGVNVHVRF